MKVKSLITAFFLSAIAPLAAQADEKPKEVKAETPLEVRAFRIQDLMNSLPDIAESIKDQATLDAAKVSFATLSKKLDTEAADIKKLPQPPNQERQKLSKKMELRDTGMSKRMRAVMMDMRKLDPAIGKQAGQMLMQIGKQIQKVGPTFEKFFEPDKAVKPK